MACLKPGAGFPEQHPAAALQQPPVLLLLLHNASRLGQKTTWLPNFLSTIFKQTASKFV